MIKIIATKCADDVIDIQINDLESYKRVTLIVANKDDHNVGIIADSITGISVAPESKPYEAFNVIIAQYERANFIVHGIKQRLMDKGFLWSEMRQKCEISIEWGNMAYSLTYRHTGMPEEKTEVVSDTTTHQIFQRVNSILFN